MAHGIYIVADIPGEAGAAIAALQREIDPKLANLGRPHLTLAGSSGLGILPAGFSPAAIAKALEDVGRETPPLVLEFGAPEKFPQTNIIMLPLPVHGPVRWLHDRIGATGLPFATARFAFTPHCTVHFFRTMTPETWRRAQQFRIRNPITITHLQAYDTRDPQPARLVCEVELVGG